jgi:hypothetical protein
MYRPQVQIPAFHTNQFKLFLVPNNVFGGKDTTSNTAMLLGPFLFLEAFCFVIAFDLSL